MSFITREDGERFVIPSYRDILSAKKSALLKKEILQLSAKYGEYITLQRKNLEQYEVAFSTEVGFLLGETVWSHFKRPVDLIYCEAIPNTTDAILVIVKNGSVYLDGQFPVDSIPEELIVFKTQQSNFDIYIFGDVPISEAPEEGKFALATSSIKSFNVLTTSAFALLPRVKAFQLKLVDQVLKAQGIGALPAKKLLIILLVIGLIWMAYIYLEMMKPEDVPTQVLPVNLLKQADPLQGYWDELALPAPTEAIHQLATFSKLMMTIPGWKPENIEYLLKIPYKVKLISIGGNLDILFAWAAKNKVNIQLESSGLYASTTPTLPKRTFFAYTLPKSLQVTMITLINRLSYIMPGENPIKLGEPMNKGKYSQATVTITFNNITSDKLDLIGLQLQRLPFSLQKVTMQWQSGSLSGSISLNVLGN